MNIIREMISDPTGQVSSMRVSTLVVYLSVLAPWVYGSFVAGAPLPMPPELVALILGQGAIKSSQRFGEAKDSLSKIRHPPGGGI